MPPVIAAIAVGLSVGVSVAGLGVAAGWAIAAGVVAAVASYASVPDAPGASGAPQTAVSADIGRGIMLNGISNVTPVNVVYGARRVGGSQIFRAVTGNTNKRLHMLLQYGEGPIAAFQNVYFNDKSVAFDKETVQRDIMIFRGVIDRSFTFGLRVVEPQGVSGIYADRLDIIADRYAADNGHFAVLGQDEPQGVLTNSWYDGTLEFFPLDESEFGPFDTVSIRVTDMSEGSRFHIVKYPTRENNWWLEMVLYDHSNEGPAQDFFQITALQRRRTEPTPDNSPKLTGEERLAYLAKNRWTLLGDMAASSQEEIPDPSYSTASEVHTVLGNQYLGNALSANDEKVIALLRKRFPVEIPDTSKFPEMALLYVVLDYNTEVYPGLPRISADVLGKLVRDPRDNVVKFSQNPKLHSLDYLTNERYGRNIDIADIDVQSFIDDANYCDELVNVQHENIGMQPRYVANGVVNVDNTHKKNLNDIESACRGATLWVAGQWRSFINKPEVPTGFVFSEDNIVGGITVSPGGKRQRFNTVVANFFNPQANWEADKLPIKVDEFFKADNATELKLSISFPFTSEWWRVQALAVTALNSSRFNKTVVFTSTIEGLAVSTGDVVFFSNATTGWEKKPFRAIKMDLQADGDVGVILQEYEPAVYDFMAPALLARAPRTTLPDLLSPPMSSYLKVKSGSQYAQVFGDGSEKPRFFVTYGAVAYAEKYQVQYRRRGAGTWAQVETPGNEVFLTDVIIGITYDVRVRGVTGVGSASPWRSTDNGATVALPDIPPDVKGLLFTQQADGTRQYDWPLLDDPAVEGYTLRYFVGVTDDWDAMTPMLSGILKASPWENNLLAAATYTFAIKSVNRYGQPCANAFFAVGNLADNRFGSGVVVLNPAIDGWPGIKTNCSPDSVGYALVANGAASWDDIADFDSWGYWSESPVAQISYEHTPYDLGQLRTVDIDIQFTAVGSGVVEVQVSADGVSYDAWHAVSGAESCRFIKARLSIAQQGSEIASALSLAITIKE